MKCKPLIFCSFKATITYREKAGCLINGKIMRPMHWMLIAGNFVVQSAVAAIPSFDSYPVAKDIKRNALSIDWSSHPDAERFKSVLSEAFGRGAKFADHYAVATWGCGSNCHMIAIIDMQTGDVTFGPIAEMDFAYQVDSRLLIANSPSAVQESILEYGCPDKNNYWAVTTHCYEWTGNDFRLIADINPCTQKNEKGGQHP